MKVVIAGVGKSGTTALFSKVLPAMPTGCRQLFEPRRYEPLGEPHTLAKILIGPTPEAGVATFAEFDKKVLIVRDPRDQMVSRLLYSPYNWRAIWGNRRQSKALLTLFKRKETDPRSVSMLDVLKFFDGVAKPGYASRFLDIATGLQFFKDHPEYFRITYDDMVADRLGPLGDYLGLPLTPGQISDGPELRRVARKGGSGDWKSWFTPSDVDYFRPLVEDAVRAYGFGDDWSLSPNPEIDPATCSHYVERILRQARKDNERPLWRRIGSHIKRLILRKK